MMAVARWTGRNVQPLERRDVQRPTRSLGRHPQPATATDPRMTPRQRRLRHGDRPTQDSVSYAQRHAGFSNRFPDACKIEIWGNH